MHHFPEGRDSILGTLRRGTLLETDDTDTQQVLKARGLASEQFSDVYRPQQHGLSSHAPAGSEGLFLALGGRSDRIVGLGFEHKDHRPRNLPEGNTVLYDHAGNVIWAKSAGGIRVESKTDKIVVVPPEGKNIYLGGDPADGGVFAKVSTVSGPSINVYARIG